MLFHSHIPLSMLKGDIRPILKIKKTLKTDSGNYRLVMKSSNIFKLLEHHVLPSLNRNLSVSSRQFGCRDDTNCQTAILTVQEVIHTYTRENSNVHCALIDLTKTFDQMYFDVLICKL